MPDTAPRLNLLDRCWLLLGTSLYEVRVSEVRVCCAGEPLEFVMYRVEPEGHPYLFLKDQSHHRHDLFLMENERDALRKEINERIESLEYLLKDLDDAD